MKEAEKPGGVKARFKVRSQAQLLVVARSGLKLWVKVCPGCRPGHRGGRCCRDRRHWTRREGPSTTDCFRSFI